jgi:RNA polymerase sigma-70 factor (ECF subfamily)
VGNPALADDLVQDCIERALRRSGGLRDDRSLAAWLRSILHNLYIDELRRRRGRGSEEDVSKLNDDYALSVPANDRTDFRDLVAAMGRLSFEHRQILLLVGVEGLNYREIAGELSIPLGTVMSRLARAREKLREAMEGGSSVREYATSMRLSQRREAER